MRGILAFVLAAAMGGTASAADTAFAPLRVYEGTWQVTRKDAAAGAKPDQLVNQCAAVGQYFTCQQTINGKPGNLLVFVAGSKPGHYYTQNITPEGRATGRADLDVTGEQWLFNNTWDDGGHTTYYRTTNTFSGRNKIHFEQSESPNGKDFKVTNSGDEVKVSSARK